jgi:hypothetical protein
VDLVPHFSASHSESRRQQHLLAMDPLQIKMADSSLTWPVSSGNITAPSCLAGSSLERRGLERRQFVCYDVGYLRCGSYSNCCPAGYTCCVSGGRVVGKCVAEIEQCGADRALSFAFSMQCFRKLWWKQQRRYDHSHRILYHPLLRHVHTHVHRLHDIVLLCHFHRFQYLHILPYLHLPLRQHFDGLRNLLFLCHFHRLQHLHELRYFHFSLRQYFDSLHHKHNHVGRFYTHHN